MALWWPLAGELHIASDDRDLMSAGRAVAAAGGWARLLFPQDVPSRAEFQR